MAVNASPMYQKAEEQYRAAKTPAEKIAALEEMLRLLPKHKASEKVQASLKQKLKEARGQLAGGHKPGGGHVHKDPFHVHRQGAGNIYLLGAPNVGKSAIVGALTKAKVEIAEFPYSTHAAVPGIAHHEDVPIQLIDMPPIMNGHAQPGMMNAYRQADAVLLVVDLAAIELMDQFEQCIEIMRAERMLPVSTTAVGLIEDDVEVSPMRMLVAANKIDMPQARDNLEAFVELEATALTMLPVSAETGEGLEVMMAALFEMLSVIRVYAKKPGKPADMAEPFVLPRDATVHDMAVHVHKDVAAQLKTARIWGEGVHDGQQVHSTHVLFDRNVVELHL